MDLGPRAELDFSTYIAERTQHFTGREWIVAEIERWRADPDAPRTFLLTGDPGIGKTAFAAHLVRDRPAWLAAWHFCSATRGGWIDPVECARSLAQQLAVRCLAFREALVHREGERVCGEVSIGTQLGGLAVGVLIERFEAAGVEDAFNRLVRAPLWELEAAGQAPDLTLLVDGLDESLAYSGAVSIADLLSRSADLPRFVRWLLTSRDERRVLRLWEGVPHFRIHAEGERNLDDVRRFVGRRLEEVLGHGGASPGDGLVDRVTAKSAGNFLYVSHLMETLARQPGALEELEELPEGLDGVYRAFLSHRDIGRDPVRWETRYLPVLSVLAVAREPLSEERIAALAERSRQEAAGDLRDLWQSFTDFLLDRGRARDYWIDARDAHHRMVAGYLGPDLHWPMRDPQRLDGYALRHLAVHLAEAGLEEVLFDLVDDPAWAWRKLELDPSGRALAADVECALDAAGLEGRQGVARLIACSLLYAALAERVSAIPPEALATLVKLGEVQRALDMAGLLSSAASRAQALGAIARALETRGAKVRDIWQQAVAAADSVGNARTAASVYLSLARNLVEGGEEPELAEATLRRAERACEKLAIQGSLALWLELAALWGALGKVAASDAVFGRACREAETVREVSVYVNRSFDHEPDFGWEKRTGDLRQELLREAVPLLARLAEPEVRARWKECLRQVLEGTSAFDEISDVREALQDDQTSPGSPGSGGPSGLLLPPQHVEALRSVAKEQRIPWSLANAAMSLAATTRPEADHWAAARAQEAARAVRSVRPGFPVYPAQKAVVLTACAAALERVGDSAGAHHYLEEVEEVATQAGGAYLQARLAGAWYEAGEPKRALGLLARASRTAGLHGWSSSREETFKALRNCASSPGPHPQLSPKERSSRTELPEPLSSALESARRIERNDGRADQLVTLARRAAEEAPGDRSEALLEEILGCAETLWAREDKGRVQGAVSVELQRLGVHTRAWEVASWIEHNNLRVDTICELLRKSRAQESREALVQRAQAARALLEDLWAAAEKVRGLAVLASTLAWAGSAVQARDLLEQAAVLAGSLLREGHESSGLLARSLGKLIVQGHASEALDILTRVTPALGFERSSVLISLGETALTAGDEESYRRLLAFVDEEPPSYPSPLVNMGKSVEISEKEALIRIRTAFGAARFQGTDAVWRHMRALAKLLQALDPEIAMRLEHRVDAVEAVVAAIRSG